MLARSASASMALVHAVSGSALDELRRWLDTGGDAEGTIVEDARDRLAELASELAQRHGIGIDHLTVTGHAVEEIVRVAHDRRADLVVTGTLGAGFVRNRTVGSTAERVVRKSSRPVLIVRQAPREPYRRVLIALDFSMWSGPSVELAAAVAPDAHFSLMHSLEVPFEGKLRLVGVDDRVIEQHRAAAREKAVRAIHEHVERASLGVGSWTALTPEDRPPWMQIVHQEHELACDLVVVGKHGRHAVEELILGSTTNRVIGEGSSDVLVCTGKDR